LTINANPGVTMARTCSTLSTSALSRTYTQPTCWCDCDLLERQRTLGRGVGAHMLRAQHERIVTDLSTRMQRVFVRLQCVNDGVVHSAQQGVAVARTSPRRAQAQRHSAQAQQCAVT
jgi:hypothetical protein